MSPESRRVVTYLLRRLIEVLKDTLKLIDAIESEQKKK